MQDQTSEPHNPDHESKQTVINPQNREPVISTPPVHTQACTSGSMTLNYLLTQDNKKNLTERMYSQERRLMWYSWPLNKGAKNHLNSKEK